MTDIEYYQVKTKIQQYLKESEREEQKNKQEYLEEKITKFVKYITIEQAYDYFYKGRHKKMYSNIQSPFNSEYCNHFDIYCECLKEKNYKFL